MSDSIIRATGKVAEVRYVLADLTQAVQSIGSRHGLQGELLTLLGDACVASCFLSANLKSSGSVSFEARFEGNLSAVVAESTPMGLVRAKISYDDIQKLKHQKLQIQPGLIRVRKLNEYAKLLSEGVVEMADIGLGRSLTAYLLQSEQTQNATGIFTKVDPNDPSRVLYSVGYYVEAFPKIDQKTLIIQEQVILDLPSMDEFYADSEFQIHALLDAVAGPFEYEVHREFEVKAFCPCDKERILRGLSTLNINDLRELAAEQVPLEAHCDFCRTRYEVSPDELRQILTSKENA